MSTNQRSVLPDCEPRGLAGVLQTQRLDLRRSVQKPLLQSFVWLDPEHFKMDRKRYNAMYLSPAEFLFPPEHICELLHPVCAALPELGPGLVPHGQHPGIGQL